jgi:hypothetical protein
MSGSRSCTGSSVHWPPASAGRLRDGAASKDAAGGVAASTSGAAVDAMTRKLTSSIGRAAGS